MENHRHAELDADLPDRRAYERRLPLEAERARRYRYPLALVRLDLDGTAPEEEEVAAVLTDARFADEAFRIDAGEFAVLLPHTDLAGAEAAAARLAGQIADASPGDGRVTVRWGAACDEGHPAALHERAGRALHTARDASAG